MHHSRTLLHAASLIVTIVIAIPATAAAGGGGAALFADGFEAGELCAGTWSSISTVEVCDGIDNNCDLAVDEGGPLCFTSDQCLEAICGGASGCVEVVASGLACDDGDACTTADTCSRLGVCVGDPLTCPVGASCSPFGGCACDDPGLDLCPGGCFDLANDTAHCGDCDIACTPGQACLTGLCVDLDPFEIDPSGAVSAVIGAAGGELQVVSGGTSVRVVFPPGALFDSHLITVTPVTSFPLPGFAAGVHLEPEGLAFFAPVAVHVTGSSSFAFGYDDQALDVHLRPATGAAGTVTASVVELWHFSGVGTGSGPAPATAPTSLEAMSVDAIARGNPAAAQVALTAHWAEVATALAAADVNRAKFDLAAHAFAVWRSLVEFAGLVEAFRTQYATGESELTGALVAERDRIFATAIAGGDWHPLLDLETWLLPRADSLGLGNDGSPVSAAALNTMLPMTVTLSSVQLVYRAGDQRYHLVGQASTSFNGSRPITNPPVAIDASLLGTIIGTVEGTADGGSFDLAVTQNREHLSAAVFGIFTGFNILEVTATTTAAADNTAPLSLVVTAQPETFAVDEGSNVTVNVLRGAGPLGFAGTVAISLSGDGGSCSLGSTSGTPDADGKVNTTVSCDAPAVFTMNASVTHRGEAANDGVNLESVGSIAGTYIGTNLEYDYGDCNSCVPRPTRIIIEAAPAGGYTVYFCDSGNATIGWCTGLPQPWTMIYTVTESGGGLSGLGSRPGGVYANQLQFSATLSGDTLSGAAYWQPGCSGGCYDDFDVVLQP